MPFGLANAPAIFQRFIQHCLCEYLDVCCFVYIDDILVFSRTREQHVIDLRNILGKLRSYSLKASFSKCQFFQSSVKFLGFIISSEGLRMDDKKVSTILDWPLPESLKQLRRFLGFCDFYRRFIPKFSGLARPLTELTKEGNFSREAIKQVSPCSAFTALKKCFSSAPLLHHFDFQLPRVIHVDSSGYAVAAVLSQPNHLGKLQPVSFYSQKLTDMERGWAIFDLELLAIVLAFEQWRAWLMGTAEPVRVYSDHANLCHFTTTKNLTPKQARWASFLNGFNMAIFHVAGKANPADSPSRRPDYLGTGPLLPSHSIAQKMVHVNDIQGITPPTSHNTYDLYFQQPKKEVLDHFAKYYNTIDPAERRELTARKDLLWFQDRIFFPRPLRTRILQMFHDAPTAGHPGIARTLSLLTHSFSWPGIRKEVIQYVSSCDLCQRVKARRQNPEGPLKPIPLPCQPWSVIGMDFITKLPLSNRFDSIMVVIDLLSKVTHFVPCKETYNADQLAQLFRFNIFRLHGIPEKIISDRGSVFVSEFWKALMRLLCITPGFSTAYHPQTNGQTERMNQVLEDYL
jgi:hypothetical protein